MKRFIAILFTTVLLGGCTSGGSGGLAALDDEGRMDFKRSTSFDGRFLTVEVETGDGRTLKLNTDRDAAYSIPYAPELPNHSGRSWTLLNAASDSTTLVYAQVSWDNDDPTDYLAIGWWLHYPITYRRRLPLSQASGGGSFIDGPQIDPSNPPRMPLQGGATYTGRAEGLYAYEYGSSWGAHAGTDESEEYTAVLTLTADFAGKTIRGCFGCEGDIEIQRTHLRTLLGWRVGDPPHAMPTDYEVHFGPTPFRQNGAFGHTDVTVKHPDRTITGSGGYWGGQFSNRPDSEGNPRLVAGFNLGEFEEADGSRGSLQGLFNVLSEAYRLSGKTQGP